MKGLVLLLSVLSLLLLAQQVALFQEQKSAHDFEFVEAVFAAEKASFQRTVIEENIDYLIKNEMQMHLDKGIIEPSVIQAGIASKLDSYFNKISLKQRPSMPEMLASFKVLVIVVKEKTIEATFFNSIPLTASFQLTGLQEFQQHLLLPKNYSVVVVLIAEQSIQLT